MSATIWLGVLLIIAGIVGQLWGAKEDKYMDETYGVEPDEEEKKKRKSSSIWMYGLGALAIVAGFFGLDISS